MPLTEDHLTEAIARHLLAPQDTVQPFDVNELHEVGIQLGFRAAKHRATIDALINKYQLPTIRTSDGHIDFVEPTDALREAFPRRDWSSQRRLVATILLDADNAGAHLTAALKKAELIAGLTPGESEKVKRWLDEEGYAQVSSFDASGKPYVRFQIERITDYGRERLQHEIESGGEGSPSTMTSTTQAEQRPAVFVSHSHANAEVAKAVVQVLRDAFDLPMSEIRASSVPGYKFEPAADLNDAMREQAINAGVVLGIITEESLQSSYVLFELGARWGAKKAWLVLLGDSNSQPPGPASSIRALRLTKTDEIHDLVEYVARVLELEAQPAQGYDSALKHLADLASSAAA